MSENEEPVRQQWRTPSWLFEYLDARFGRFSLDAFADEDNALCARHNSREDPERWPWVNHAAVFGNPPFSLSAQAMRTAHAAHAAAGTRTTLILPAAVNSARWHTFAPFCLTLWPTRRVQFDPPEGVVSDDRNRGDIAIHVFGEMRGQATLDLSEIEGAP